MPKLQHLALLANAAEGSTVPPRNQPIPIAEGPTAGMISKRHFLALGALCFGLSLGACAQFSGTVADHWPHWAGGEPADTPPRPNSPGYQEYIAHRQAQGAAP